MDLGKAYAFSFDDPRFLQKVLIAALFTLLSVIFIGAPFLFGYLLRLLRNVHAGMEHPLPEWDDLGPMAVDGLLLIIVLFIYNLPNILLSCLGQLSSIPVNGRELNDAYAIGLFAASSAFSCLSLALSIAAYVFTPALCIRYARTGDISESLKFGEALAIMRRNGGSYAAVLLIGFVNGILGLLGIVALCLGVFLTIPFSYFVTTHLIGQLWASDDAALPDAPAPA
jgi:hypothetical protein